MREQRVDRRYKGVARHSAAFEGPSWRVMGQVADASRRGIGLNPMQSIGRPSAGDPIRIEVALDGKLLVETGTLARVETGRLGAQLDGVMDPSVFAELKEGGFSLAMSEGRALIDGRLTGFAARHDVLEFTRRRLTITPTYAHGIDSAGVALLLLALERGARLAGCSRPVAAIMEVAGACARCGSCEGATAL